MTPELIVALDVETQAEALSLVKKLKAWVKIFKIGPRVFIKEGRKIIEKIHYQGKEVFLDLKFYDLPSIVSSATQTLLELGVEMFTLHLLGGEKMVSLTKEKLLERAAQLGLTPPKIFGVTLLTSYTPSEYYQIFNSKGSLKEAVLRLCEMARKVGIDGVVASAQETPLIKETFGKNLLVITPGIRLSGSQKSNQQRVATPTQAKAGGADYIVVGRPIIKASSPESIVQEILAEMSS